ncbi:DNA alkylation repair protein [Candidatus Bipolaricaulota bacterium]
MDLYTRIATALEALAPSGLARGSASKHDRRVGIKTLAVRRLAKQFSGEFRSQAWDDQVRVVQHLLNDGSYEAAHLGVFLLGLAIDCVDFVDAKALDSIVGAFRGWSVTDAFCIEVLQPLFTRFTSDVLSLIAGWAEDKNLWKRRASVVVFVRKIGASGRYTSDGLHACDRLMADSEDLVRKAVGWALKDLMRGDRQRVLEYVADLRKRGVPSVITLYALRDVQGVERQRILAIGT